MKTTTTLRITDKGEEYYDKLQSQGYSSLTSEQRVEFDILCDLLSEEDEIRLETLFRSGRSSILGRLFIRAPELETLYARVLSRLIKQGYIKAQKSEPTKEER